MARAMTGRKVVPTTLHWLGKTLVKLSVGHKQFILNLYPTTNGLSVIHGGQRILMDANVILRECNDRRISTGKRGRSFALRAQDDGESIHSKDFPTMTQEPKILVLRSPIPGMVAAVHVKEKQSVQEGQTLLLIEAMKMHNPVRAPKGGKIHKLFVKPGASVESAAVLLEIDARRGK